jgi:hypothetical protein
VGCIPLRRGIHSTLGNVKSWARPHVVRNIFKILGCHERDDTSQKSISKTKFTSAEGYTPGCLGGRHTGQKVSRGFIWSLTVPLLPLDWAGFGVTVYAVG